MRATSLIFLISLSIGLTCATNEVESDVSQQQTTTSRPILGKLLDKFSLGDSHINTLLVDHEHHHAHLSLVQILELSGFRYELVNVTSDDGYVTQLTRIVNPLARRRYMKRTPVVLYAGQGMAPAVFLMTEIGHQRPLAWPVSMQWPHQRQEGNRSLAVTLANNGYDVWLVPARGVDAQNRERASGSGGGNLASMRNIYSLLAKHSSLANFVQHEREHLKGGNATISSERRPYSDQDTFNWSKFLRLEKLHKLAKRFDWHSYWSFNQDDIVQFEFGRQLEAIQRHTGCGKLSLISYSNGAYISFAFMASHDKWARDYLDTVVSIGPAVYLNKLNLVLGTAGLLGKLSPASWPVLESNVDKVARFGLAKMCSLKPIRYVVCKLLLNQLYGHSDLFESRLELAMLDYLGKPLSSHGLKQTLQTSHSGHLRRYDFGPLANLIAYEQLHPPAYQLRNIQHPRLVLVSGGEDQIVGKQSVEKLRNELACGDEKVNQLAGQSIQVRNYNHLDLLAASDTLERVNLPILQILDDRHLETDYYREEASSLGSSTDMRAPDYKYHGDGSSLSADEQLLGGVFRDEIERIAKNTAHKLTSKWSLHEQ